MDFNQIAVRGFTAQIIGFCEFILVPIKVRLLARIGIAEMFGKLSIGSKLGDSPEN